MQCFTLRGKPREHPPGEPHGNVDPAGGAGFRVGMSSSNPVDSFAFPYQGAVDEVRVSAPDEA